MASPIRDSLWREVVVDVELLTDVAKLRLVGLSVEESGTRRYCRCLLWMLKEEELVGNVDEMTIIGKAEEETESWKIE